MAALLAVGVTAESSAQTPRQRDFKFWSATLHASTDEIGDHTDDVTIWPNITALYGYWRGVFLNAGSLSDNTFEWKGTTYTIRTLSKVSEGRVTATRPDGSAALVDWGDRSIEFSASGNLRSDPDVGLLKLHIDSTADSTGKLRHLQLHRNEGCGSCSQVWETSSTDIGPVFREGAEATPIWLTRQVTNTNPTGLPVVNTDGAPRIRETATVSTDLIADADGMSDPKWEYEWILVDGETEEVIDGETEPTYLIREEDLGKKLKVRVTYYDDYGFDEVLTSAATSTIKGAARITEIDVPAPANGDVFLNGETIRFDVTFSHAVKMFGEKNLKFQLGPDETLREAAYKRSRDADTLRFEYTVGDDDLDADGLTIEGSTDNANGPFSGTGVIGTVLSNDNAELAYEGRADIADREVDGVRPEIRSAFVAFGTRITAIWSERLATPTSTDGWTITVSTGTAPTVQNVAMGGGRAFLNLSGSIDANAEVTLSYAPPSTEPIRDEAGNSAKAFTNRTVPNRTPEPPTVEEVRIKSSGSQCGNRAYVKGDDIVIGVRFNQPVIVGVGGTPTITMRMCGYDLAVNYARAATTYEREFIHTVGDADFSCDGQGPAITANTLSLNGGAIRSGITSANANLEHDGVARAERRHMVGRAHYQSSLSGGPEEGKTYTIGEEFDVTLAFAGTTFTRQVGTHNFHLGLLIGEGSHGDPTQDYATFEDQITTQLIFAEYTVKEGDVDNDGVAIPRDALRLNGGEITTSNTNTRLLECNEPVGPDAKYKIDGIRPAVTSAKVDGSTLTLEWSETLDSASLPPGSAFTIALSQGTAPTVSSVAYANGTMTLTLSSAVASTAETTLDYTPPTGTSAKPVKDVPGNDAAAFSRSVQNMGQALPKVTGVSASPGFGSLNVSWDAVAGADGYDIVIRGGETPRTETVSGGTTTRLKVTGLVPLATYAIQVGANREGATRGELSDPVRGSPWAAALASVSVTSDPNDDGRPGDDNAYATGDAIRIDATFNTSVDVGNTGGKPEIVFSLDTSERRAAYAEGSGSNTLRFEYIVKAGDSASTISIAQNAIRRNFNTIRLAGTVHDAILTHLGSDTTETVDGTPPTLSSASVDTTGTRIDLVFDENLDTANPPPRSAFAITANGVAASPGSITVADATVTLADISPTIASGNAVTVTYTDPGAGNDTAAVQDLIGNDAEDFTTGADSVASVTNSSTAGFEWEMTLSGGAGVDGDGHALIEEGGAAITATLEITTTARYTSAQTVTLAWGTDPLSAADGRRVVGAGGATTIEIAAGARSGTLVINAPEEPLGQGTELYSPTERRTLSATLSGNTIADAELAWRDDERPPVATVTDAPESVNEGDAIEVEVGLSPAFSSLASATERTVTVTVTDPDGALSGTLPTSVAFAANETATTLTVTAAENTTMNDGARQATFTLKTTTASPYTLGTPFATTVTVLDDDTPPSAPRNLTAEPGDGEATLAWQAPETTHGQGITRYEYQQKAGTGAFGGWQMIPASNAETTEYTVTGLTNGTIYTFQVRAVNDIGNGDESNDAEAGVGPSWELTITDASGNPVTELVEGGASATVRVSITNAITFPTNQTIALQWGGLDLADSPLSGTGGATSLTLTAGQMSASLGIRVTDDALFTPTRTERLVGLYGGGATGGTDLTVVDDENPPRLTIELAPTRIVEGESGEMILRLTRGIGGTHPETTVGVLAPPPGVAIAGERLDGTDIRIALGGGQTEFRSQITVGENTNPGDSGTAVFTLTANPSFYTLGSPHSTSVTIIDDDAPPGAPVNLTATAGNARVTLAWRRPASYEMTTLAGYEERHREDGGMWTGWTPIGDPNVETTGGDVEGLTNNAVYTFEVQARNDAGPGPAADVTAIPRDHGLTVAPNTLTEGETATITITPEGAPFTGAKTVTVIFATRSGSDRPTAEGDFAIAKDGNELTADPRTFQQAGFSGSHPHYEVVLSPTDNEVELEITARDDGRSECGEELTVFAFTDYGTASEQRVGPTASGADRVRIEDDDRRPTGPEHVSVNARTVTLEFEQDLTVRHEPKDPEDPGYKPNPPHNYFTLFVGPTKPTQTVIESGRIGYGTLARSFTLVERTVSLTFPEAINGPAWLRYDPFSRWAPLGPVPGGRCLDRRGAAAFIAELNGGTAEPPALPAIEIEDAEGTEGTDPDIAFTVTLNPFSGETVVVSYRTVARTATKNVDYTHVAGTLIFAPGQTTKTVRVPITDDNVGDDGETFLLFLYDVSGATKVVTGSYATGTIRNTEDEPAAPSNTLTASFTNVPAEHGGGGESNRFTFDLSFSENPKVGYAKLRDHAFSISGGDVKQAQRKVQGSNRTWTITVEPEGWGDVSLTLPGGRACTHSGGICTADDRRLSNSPSATVQGPAALSVADASATEGTDATLDFAVSLDRASTLTVTVDYATSDGTATAGDDYTATSGTLTFAPGDVATTVSVPILDDVHDDGGETLTLTLSNASNARIADGTATGTIENSDPIPKAWLARFGRTVADHVVDAVAARLEGSSGGGSQVTLGGQRIPVDGVSSGASPGGSSGGDLRESAAADTLAAFADRISGEGAGTGSGTAWARWDDGGEDAAKRRESRGLTERELLLGNSFVLALGGAEANGTGTAWTAWGRAVASRFDGEADGLVLDGDVTTFTFGADAARGRWLGGVALAHSTGEGGFRDHADGDHAGRGSGTLESTLTGVHPYLRLQASERLSLWGVLGYGTGDLTLAVDASGDRPRRTWQTETEMQMAAAGARGVLLSAEDHGGFELAARGDARLVRMFSDAAMGADGAGKLSASESQTSRLRFILEGSHRIEMAGGQTLTPSLEVGLRHDGGDAETGTGVEVGSGVRYADPALGLTVEGKARGLLAHEDADYREWGASASVRLDPGAAGRGLSLSLSPAWGADSGGAERLWGLRDARGLAGNDDVEPAGRLDAEAGWGLGAFGGRGLMTPFAGLALSDAGERTWRSGVRWTLGPDMAFGVEGALREAGNDNAAERGIGFKLTARF